MARRFMILCMLLPAGIPAPGLPMPGYQLETMGPCEIPEVSEKMRQGLQPEGLRIVGDSGVFCEIWLRKVLPQKPGSSGTEYSTLVTGSFAGIIRYPGKGGDYRGQAVRVGTYTMRYQTIPSDGNHMGVSPSPDFFLLSPVSIDQDPDAVPEYQDLIKWGKQASGTNHPNPLYLTYPEGGTAPVFRVTDENHWALEATTKARPAVGADERDFSIALILIGKAEG